MSKDLCITPLQHEMRAARAVEPFVVAIPLFRGQVH